MKTKITFENGISKISIRKYEKDWNLFYKNRWGHFVWTNKDYPEDKNWPGIKPPKGKNVEPVLIGEFWYWKEL